MAARFIGPRKIESSEICFLQLAFSLYHPYFLYLYLLIELILNIVKLIIKIAYNLFVHDILVFYTWFGWPHAFICLHVYWQKLRHISINYLFIIYRNHRLRSIQNSRFWNLWLFKHKIWLWPCSLVYYQFFLSDC